MTDLVITPANVLAYEDGTKKTKTVKAGGTVAAGQLVYRASNGKYLPVDVDSATAEARVPAGLALNGAGLDQPLIIQTAGDVNPGATVVVGTIYVASDTPGGIMPSTDLEAGDYVTIVGVAITASRIKLGFLVSGVPVP